MTIGFDFSALDFSQNTKWEKHKPKRSGVEKGAESMVAQDVAGRDKAFGKAQDTYGQFEGPIKDSPYYKSLLATSTDATSNAYENAKASSAARAKAAGFGYDSPIGGAVSRETTGQEAGALAELPAKAYAATAPLSLEAAKGTAGIGTELGREGTSIETGAVTPLEEQYQNRRAKWASDLAKVSPLGGVLAGDPSGLANV
jgi:hypothetical protein